MTQHFSTTSNALRDMQVLESVRVQCLRSLVHFVNSYFYNQVFAGPRYCTSPYGLGYVAPLNALRLLS